MTTVDKAIAQAEAQLEGLRAKHDRAFQAGWYKLAVHYINTIMEVKSNLRALLTMQELANDGEDQENP
jgi:hypothetical protein